MARVSLARQQLSDAGLLVAYSPAAKEGHAVENNGRVLLHIKNDSDMEAKMTIKTGYRVNGLKLEDRIIKVPPRSEVLVGPLDPLVYNQTEGLTGQVIIDYDAPGKVNIAALLMPREAT